MTRFALRVPTALVLLAVLAAPARAEGTVYAVLVADTNGPDIGKAVQKDCETVEALLAGGIGRQYLRVSHLRGKDVTPARLREHIRQLPVRSTDTLLCFLACHGGTAPGGRHFLQFSGSGEFEPVLRSDVRDLLTAKKARLTVLMSDSCSNPVEITLPTGRGKPKVFGVPRASDVRPCFRKLFLETSGLVDINGSYDQTYAWFNDEEGGVFSQALLAAFLEFQNEADVSWASVYAEVKHHTEKTFDAWRKRWVEEADRNPDRLSAAERKVLGDLKRQETQTTQAFYLAGTRLKLIVRNGKVIDLPLDSPARAAGVEVGDVIIGVDGRPVRTGNELDVLLGAPLQARAASPVEFRFTVRRGGATHDMIVKVPAPR
jgi:hypothetical protein